MARLNEIFSRFIGKKADNSNESIAKPTQKTSKEGFETSQDWINSLLAGKVGGFKSKFISDVYKERILYPHEEMNIAKKGYRYNGYVASGCNTRAEFLTGGTISAVSKDEGTQNWVEKTLTETGLKNMANLIGVDLTVVGNWYAERIKKPDKTFFYEYIPNAERMYADLDEKGLIKGWMLEIPERLLNGANYDTITYYGDRRRTIKGKKLEKEKVFQLRLGVSEIPAYGRGLVAPVINDIEILLEIERAMAVIARYKAIPKKLIQLDRGDDVDGNKAAGIYASQIGELADEENPFIPEHVKVDDLSYSGKDLNMSPIIEYLKKKITVCMAPSYILHGEETNYAVSRDQKEAFILTINTQRENLANQIKREIRSIAREQKQAIADFEIKFGDYDLGQEEYKSEQAVQLYNSGIITLNESREMIGFEPDNEIGDLYYPDVQSNSQLGGANAGQPANEKIKSANRLYQQNTEKKKLRTN